MSLPVRHLPVLQNWDCQGCGNCCRDYQITVTEEERQRILTQGWEGRPEMGGLPLFIRAGPPWARHYRLNHREGGSCVFLSPEGRCRIHERFGATSKPLPCRLYPFILVPAGDHWRVGLRFACPAAAANEGRPLAEHQPELNEAVPHFEQKFGLDTGQIPPPPLQWGQAVVWADFMRFVQALQAILRDRGHRFEHRMRMCLALDHLCRRARFEKIKGGRLFEFLDLLSTALPDETPADPAALPPPGWVGRVLFRQALALYVRKNQGRERGLVRTRLGLALAALRFARGQGPVPRLHARLPETTFERAEEPAGPLPEAADEILERYYLVKVGSLQFCGAAAYGFAFWEGLEALALTLPAILWLSRVLPAASRTEAVTQAVSIVDENFGFNPILGMRRQRLGLRLLARRGELEQLVAWYAR
jgi:lysine-N-methylase